MRHLSTQYFNGNQLKEVAAPTAGTDAANKTYVDQAVASAGGGGTAIFTLVDDGNGNITIGLANTSSGLSVNDDNNGNITISLT